MGLANAASATASRLAWNGKFNQNIKKLVIDEQLALKEPIGGIVADESESLTAAPSFGKGRFRFPVPKRALNLEAKLAVFGGSSTFESTAHDNRCGHLDKLHQFHDDQLHAIST